MSQRALHALFFVVVLAFTGLVVWAHVTFWYQAPTSPKVLRDDVEDLRKHVAELRRRVERLEDR